MTKGREKKNAFLMEMNLYESKFEKLQERLCVPKDARVNLAQVMRERIIEWETTFQDYGDCKFYETISGSYLTDLFIEIVKGRIEDLEKELQYGIIQRLIQAFKKNAAIYEYLTDYYFIKKSTISLFSDMIIEGVRDYILLYKDIIEEEYFNIIENFAQEVAVLYNQDEAVEQVEKLFYRLIEDEEIQAKFQEKQSLKKKEFKD